MFKLKLNYIIKYYLMQNSNNKIDDICSFYFIFGVMCGLLLTRMDKEFKKIETSNT